MRKHHVRGGTPVSEPRIIQVRRKGPGKEELALALCVSLGKKRGLMGGVSVGFMF